MPTPGARRAGQDRAAPEGSLDAPKRSRDNPKSERRGSLRDVNPYERHRHVTQHGCGLGSQRRHAYSCAPAYCGVRGFLTSCETSCWDAVLSRSTAVAAAHRGALTTTRSWPDSDPDGVTIWDQIFMTNRPRGDTDIRGVSDPAGRVWGRLRGPRAGSLTPRLLLPHRGPGMNGRHTTPPVASDSRHGNMSIHKRLQHLGCGSRRVKAFAHRCDSEGRWRLPPLWGCVPLLGPLRRER
jgi:hypothetical protein